jgi:hypothetical protein
MGKPLIFFSDAFTNSTEDYVAIVLLNITSCMLNPLYPLPLPLFAPRVGSPLFIAMVMTLG